MKHLKQFAALLLAVIIMLPQVSGTDAYAQTADSEEDVVCAEETETAEETESEDPVCAEETETATETEAEAAEETGAEIATKTETETAAGTEEALAEEIVTDISLYEADAEFNESTDTLVTVSLDESGTTELSSTASDDFYYFTFDVAEDAVYRIIITADYDGTLYSGQYDEEEDDYGYSYGTFTSGANEIFFAALTAGTQPVYYFCLYDADDSVDFTMTITEYPGGTGLSDAWDDNLTWTLNDGTLTISGSGGMTLSTRGYVSSLPDDAGDIVTALVIESGVTSISSYAFGSGFRNLASIDIGDTVTYIDSYAFYWTDALTQITIPGNVETIGGSAFQACDNLTDITIEDGVKYIDSWAFRDAPVSEITIPSSVVYLGMGVFSDCDNLTQVTFEGDFPELDTYLDDSGVYYNAIFCKFSKEEADDPADQAITVYYSSENDGWTQDNMTLMAAGSDVTFVDTKDGDTFTSSGTTEELSSANVTLSSSSFTYTGSAQKPSVTVKNAAGETLTQGTDYTVTYASGLTEAGSYTVTITGIGSYSGSVTETFKIKARSLSTYGSASLSKTTYTYNGSAKKPSVTVKATIGSSTKKLTKGTDYTVTYASGRKSCGRYKVTIKGTGNYSGSITKYFYIKPAKANTPKLSSTKSKRIKVSWTKSKGGVTGYQISYRVKGTSKWKSVYTTSTSKTISSLKSGKTYQIRIRAYKKISGKKYYGSWSKIKTKKCK